VVVEDSFDVSVPFYSQRGITSYKYQILIWGLHDNFWSS